MPNPEYVNAPYHCSIIDAKWGRIEVCEGDPGECDIWVKCGDDPRVFIKIKNSPWWNELPDVRPFRKYLPVAIRTVNMDELQGKWQGLPPASGSSTIHSGLTPGPISVPWFDCNTGELKVFSDGEWRIQQPVSCIPPWTTQPPTVDGWYWVKWQGFSPVIMKFDGNRYVTECGVDDPWTVDTLEHAQWSGPIPEPPK